MSVRYSRFWTWGTLSSEVKQFFKMRRPRLTQTAAFSIFTAVTRPPASRTVSTSPLRAQNRHSAAQSTPSVESEGIRVNKCFKSFASRRQSDSFIESQRVTINESLAHPGARVKPGDTVKLDGQVVDWERLTVDADTGTFIYIKHWKAPGIVSTTNTEEPDNLIAQIRLDSTDRIFPIGRLDEASTGIILVTSDGRLPNAVLGADRNCSKEYLVLPDMYVTDEHLDMMRKGVQITTSRQSDRRRLVAPTLPCSVERGEGFQLKITLQEGRNRQIRKMLGALGYTTREIHRVAFMGIGLDGLDGPGDSCQLNERDLTIVKEALKRTNDAIRRE